MTTRRVIQYSGGISSWYTALRTIQRYGADGVVLLFADVKAEDPDTYRFIDETAASLGAPLVTVCDGRTPRDVMRDERMIGNSMIDPCSRILKRQLLDRWHRENCSPDETVLYFGIGPDDSRRIPRIRERMLPWITDFPLLWEPVVWKREQFAELLRQGIAAPALYDYGFPHGNCGGACIKAGQAQWALLWRVNRCLYLEWEEWEEEMRKEVGNHSILRDRSGGTSRPLTLLEFRQRLERQESFAFADWGGCGCAVPGD